MRQRIRRQTLTIPELADLMGMPVSTAYAHANSGLLPIPVIESGQTKRVSRAAVEDLLGPVSLPDDPAEAPQGRCRCADDL